MAEQVINRIRNRPATNPRLDQHTQTKGNKVNDTECQSDLHKHELPNSFLVASSMADDRFDAGWDNRECPDCGTWGWEPPAAGAGKCLMCGLEIHYSEQWERWQHNEDGAIYCPGKSASVATPDAGATT